jgi:hypothetical protein
MTSTDREEYESNNKLHTEVGQSAVPSTEYPVPSTERPTRPQFPLSRNHARRDERTISCSTTSTSPHAAQSPAGEESEMHRPHTHAPSSLPSPRSKPVSPSVSPSQRLRTSTWNRRNSAAPQKLVTHVTYVTGLVTGRHRSHHRSGHRLEDAFDCRSASSSSQ